jgi:Ala-tRNA(Pro) deacylase
LCEREALPTSVRVDLQGEDRTMLARHVQWYIHNHGVAYDVVHHRRTATSAEAASAARVPARRIAKPVIVEDERGYLMIVVPASRRVPMRDLRHLLHRNLELAFEHELENIFYDCDLGAIPPLAAAYGIPALVDRSLLHEREIYFEGGDHEDLVHVERREFLRLMKGARFANLTEPC